jgi:membrane protein implicated in regulation of membrane protease activity
LFLIFPPPWRAEKVDALLTPWLIWFLVGVGLAFLELQLPGFVVLFFAIGCWFVAGALLVWDLSLTQQLILFLVGSVVSLIGLRRVLKNIFLGTSSDGEDGVDDLPLGMRVRVAEKISPPLAGKVHYRGSYWDATADEGIPSGEIVEIMGFSDHSRSTFRVRKAGDRRADP